MNSRPFGHLSPRSPNWVESVDSHAQCSAKNVYPPESERKWAGPMSLCITVHPPKHLLPETKPSSSCCLADFTLEVCYLPKPSCRNERGQRMKLSRKETKIMQVKNSFWRYFLRTSDTGLSVRGGIKKDNGGKEMRRIRAMLCGSILSLWM